MPRVVGIDPGTVSFDVLGLEDGDAFLVPRGYHGPCVAAPDHDMYYLNVMAGPRRTWKFHNAAEHEWLINT